MRSEIDRPLQARALREIELALYAKLRAHRLSEGFIERYGEDALQQGLAEYTRAVKDGAEIENPDGWVVRAAFCRAIDELRREARSAHSRAAEATLARGGGVATEEAAVEYLEAEKLHEAIGMLSPEERRVLSLYYFEERSARDGAQVLQCSERTFRRRRERALRSLSRRFGVPAPEPGSELAIEVGLAAWLSLSGAQIIPTHGALEQLVAAADSLRDTASGLLGRTRDHATRLLGSGGGEAVGAVASGPAGKAAGACAGALVACALSGVIGPGVGGVDLIRNSGPAKPPATHHLAKAPHDTPAPLRPNVSTPPSVAAAAAAVNPGADHHSQPPEHRFAASASQRRHAEARRAAASQQLESASPGTSESASPAPVAESSATSGSAPATSNPAATEAASEQFGP